ncbi:MAG: hypothetical protein F4X67_13180, partial [Gemmatimonadales bacterium]|nr:hypothetical protein [Gemmatimonadales bacterium]
MGAPMVGAAGLRAVAGLLDDRLLAVQLLIDRHADLFLVGRLHGTRLGQVRTHALEGAEGRGGGGGGGAGGGGGGGGGG